MTKEQIIKELEEKVKTMENRARIKRNVILNNNLNEYQHFRQSGKLEELENQIDDLKLTLKKFKGE